MHRQKQSGVPAPSIPGNNPTSNKKKIPAALIKNRWLYLMLIPGLLFFIVFKYAPMFGLIMAFENYQPFSGFLKSEWVGFAHFQRFFSEPTFWMLFKNTLILGLYNMVFYFPLPIIISLLLNEIRVHSFKRTVQTFIYIPHFLSWVVIVSISYTFLSSEGGIVNNFLQSVGAGKIDPLLSVPWFRPLIMLQIIWKDVGWGTIIFLAAIASVDPELYTAAEVDGAGRWRKIWNITLPSIRSTIVILLILRLGNFLDTGFEQLMLMVNSINREVGEVFDTYVYMTGIVGGQFSYTAAVGLFKAVVALILIIGSNYAAKKIGEEGIY